MVGTGIFTYTLLERLVIPTRNSGPKNVYFFRAQFVKCSVELNATFLKLWAQAGTVTEKKLML
jgi:hypothetical protein